MVLVDGKFKVIIDEIRLINVAARAKSDLERWKSKLLQTPINPPEAIRVYRVES